jgi:hypothetical protein
MRTLGRKGLLAKRALVPIVEGHWIWLLEQDFKQHPTTKFNKTPSAKYILL